MKKISALLLACVLLFGITTANAAKSSKYEKLTVGITTPFTGNFLDDALGSNLSDQDVRSLIHGYNLVNWDPDDGKFEFDRTIVTGGASSDHARTYTFSLADDLTYNDGTPITARDYAFTLLLLGSAELKEAAGSRISISRILGGEDYQNGSTQVLAGFRLRSDYQFSVTIDPSYAPYFYELKVLDVSPLPISVIAPGCTVKDDGNGAYISGTFNAELLKQTLLDPENGYITHPKVTSGPYQVESYDGSSILLKLNEAYAGDADGNKPSIPQIEIKAVKPEAVIGDLNAGELDLVVRCVRLDQIQSGMSMVGDDFKMKSYMRAGLSFISFCAEKGPTEDLEVRRALAMCMDKQQLTKLYSGGFGTPVSGYYGIGQWMFRMANGAIQQEEDDEEDWSDLKIQRIHDKNIDLDVEVAGKLLYSRGWNLNAGGKDYNSGNGGVRYKKEGDQLVPLKLKLVYPEENGTAPLLQETFLDNLKQAGVEIETEALPWEKLLAKFYMQEERDCDMILIGTNFADVFDPTGEYDADGISIRNGIRNKSLPALAVAMRSTEPGNASEYCRRWLAYLEERCDTIPEIPLYSDAYVDFHTSSLHNYNPAPTGLWTTAVRSAYLSDYAAEEEPVEEEDFEEDVGEDEDF